MGNRTPGTGSSPWNRYVESAVRGYGAPPDDGGRPGPGEAAHEARGGTGQEPTAAGRPGFRTLPRGRAPTGVIRKYWTAQSARFAAGNRKTAQDADSMDEAPR